MTLTNTEAIRNVLKSAGSTYVTATFVKRNGETRALTFNPRHHLETQGTGTPRPEDLFTVVDSTNTKWRSFKAGSVVSIKSRGKVYSFNQELAS